MTSLVRHLFVYGTLRLGAAHPMARLLAARARLVGPARVRGRLYDLGPYPGVVTEGAVDRTVRGDLYALSDSGLPDLLARLDDYEGCARPGGGPALFLRREASALPDDGVPVPCWIYVYARPIDTARDVPSGDWLADQARS